MYLQRKSVWFKIYIQIFNNGQIKLNRFPNEEGRIGYLKEENSREEGGKDSRRVTGLWTVGMRR